MSAQRPELTVIEDPLSGFDGELSPANLDLLARRVQELDAALKAAKGEIAELGDVLTERDSTLKSLEAKLRKAKRDREHEARGSDLWPIAERLFAIWKRATGNKSPRSQLTADRFELVAPFLRGAEQDTITTEPGPPRNALEDCCAAIIGRVFDHYSVVRANGSTKRFWEWDRIFGSADNFEDSRDRRPRDWRQRLAQIDEGPR